MITDNVGLKYGYNISDANKTNTGTNVYARMTREAISTGLEDAQVIAQTTPASGQDTQREQDTQSSSNDKREMYRRSRFNPEESLLSEEVNEYSPKIVKEKETEKKVKQELQDKILNTKNNANEVSNDVKLIKPNKESEHLKGKHDGFNEDCPLCECETCKNRRYQDASGDSAVSFQQPTKMNPEKAIHMVKSHEMEHVRREQYEAKKEGKRIVSQSVQIKTDVCPECGKMYVAGGLTRTRTKDYNPDFIDLFKVGADDITKQEIV